MIKLAYDNDAQRGDFLRSTGANLDTDEGLETAVTISYFTDARAKPSDGVNAEQDQRGWWGTIYLEDQPDIELGSRLWLLKRMKLTDESLRLAGSFAKESLLWLMPDVASEIIAVAERIQGVYNAAVINTQIIRPRKSAPRFEGKWKVQFGV